MNKYLKFKKSLEQRRNSTLKEIEKSQETIKKLMMKFKKEKEMNNDTKVTIKIDKSKERSIKRHSRNSHYVSKKNSESQNKGSDKRQRTSTQKKAEKSM